MATKKSQTPTTQNKPQPSKAPPPPLPPKSNPKLPKNPAVKPPASGEKSAGKILPLPTSGSKSDKDKLGQAGKETNTTTTSPSGQNAGGNFERGSVALSQRPDAATDTPQKRGQTTARRLPTTIGRQDYEYALDRMAYDSPLVRRFVKRLNSQRDLVDGFLNSSPSLELVLNKMFMEFGRDEEEDKLLMKAVRLHLKGRGGNTAEQDTPESEPEMPTAEDVQMVRDFPTLYEAWNADPDAFERDFNNLVEQRREMLRALNGLSGAAREQLLDTIGQFDAEIEQRRAILEGRATEYYTGLLEEVFGYDIIIYTDYLETSEEQMQALTTLGESNLYILDYLTTEVFDDNETLALEAFRTFFSTNPNAPEGPQVVVHLGDDANSGGSLFGYVPLPESAPPEKLEDIYLGSQVSVATITHEFLHQLDRYFNGLLSSMDPNVGLPTFLLGVRNAAGGDGISMTRDLINERSGASDRALAPEIFADLGMTAILDGLGERVHPSMEEIGFRDNSINAQNFECAFPLYLRHLIQFGTATGFDPNSECA